MDNEGNCRETYEFYYINDSSNNCYNECINRNFYDKSFNYKKYERFQPEIQISCGRLVYCVPCIGQFQCSNHCHKQWRFGINGSYLC